MAFIPVRQEPFRFAGSDLVSGLGRQLAGTAAKFVAYLHPKLWIRAGGHWGRRQARNWQLMRELQRQRRALARLSGRDLRDIGITRYDVEFLLRQSDIIDRER
jgi:uncharacterized protein YjiS (DUF1127 family)